MPQVRVWAEERGPGVILLSWAWPDDIAAVRDAAADARTVAATIGVRPGVEAAFPEGDGVLVQFLPAVIGKPELAAALRLALAQEGDLKSRLSEAAKRAPTYLSLAKTLTLDERISPVPEAARAAATRRPGPTAMIPGFTTISRIQSLLPVLRSLSTWSRTAPPGVVEEHLSAAGLTRDLLDGDLATTQEAIAYARDYATQTGGRFARKAGALASQATAASKQYIEQRNAQRQISTDDPAPPAE